MNTLSDELICCILDHVDARTLLSSVQFVSKRLRGIALENQIWYRISPSASAKEDAVNDSLYSHWTEVDWLSEWKWYELVFIVADYPIGAMPRCGLSGLMLTLPSLRSRGTGRIWSVYWMMDH